jgi:hypothetical protein
MRFRNVDFGFRNVDFDYFNPIYSEIQNPHSAIEKLFFAFY